MWFLYGLSTAWILSIMTNVIYTFFFASNVPKKRGTLENHLPNADDEYTLLCYVINYEDGSVDVVGETTDDEIEELNDLNKIDYITIKYMFNGKLMKYVTRKLDIQFPIYKFNIDPPKFLYYPEIMFLNKVDVTDYLRPYLGPLCNFYSDREEPVNLEDSLRDHPDFKNFNFEEGVFEMISNKTPLNGRKIMTKELPCSFLTWKRHAAVDPRDEDKLKDVEYELIN